MASSLPHRPLVIATPAGAGYHSSSFSILPSFLIYKNEGALQHHASRQLLQPNPSLPSLPPTPTPPIDRQAINRYSDSSSSSPTSSPPSRLQRHLLFSPPTKRWYSWGPAKNLVPKEYYHLLSIHVVASIVNKLDSYHILHPAIFVLKMLLSSAHVEPVFAGGNFIHFNPMLVCDPKRQCGDDDAEGGVADC